LKITQNAQGTHVFKRNIFPAIGEKSASWTTHFLNHTNYPQTVKTDSNQRISKEISKNPTMMREMLSP